MSENVVVYHTEVYFTMFVASGDGRMVDFVSGEDFLFFSTKKTELEAYKSVHHSVHLNVRCCTF